MSLSSKIFLAMGLGIACGLFFGEMTAIFKVPADVFILLLQMTVLPYVTLSLIVGFGSLTFADAKLMAIKGTAVMLLLWALAFTVLALMPLAFPAWETASFFSAAMIEAKLVKGGRFHEQGLIDLISNNIAVLPGNQRFNALINLLNEQFIHPLADDLTVVSIYRESD